MKTEKRKRVKKILKETNKQGLFSKKKKTGQ